MDLHFTEAKQSRLLKANLSEMSPVAIARMLGDEQQSMSLRQRVFVANLIKEVHRLGVIRGQAVNVKK